MHKNPTGVRVQACPQPTRGTGTVVCSGLEERSLLDAAWLCRAKGCSGSGRGARAVVWVRVERQEARRVPSWPSKVEKGSREGATGLDNKMDLHTAGTSDTGA